MLGEATIFSLYLSSFFFGVLVLAIGLFSRYDLGLLKRGKEIPKTKAIPIAIIVVAVLLGAGFAYFYLYLSGPQLLQLFYIFVFTAAWIIGLFFLLPIHRLSLRFSLSCIIALVLLVTVQAFPASLWQNAFMTLSLIWAGPILVRKFNISMTWASIVLVLCMLVDVYNIMLATRSSGSVSFSDETFFMNGIIVFHSALLGIGDFFLAMLIVAFTQKKFGPRAALALAFFIAVPRVAIRPLFHQLEGMTIPYYVLLVPVTLFYWWLLTRMKNLVRPERSAMNS